MYEFAEVDPYWPPAASWKRFPGSPSTHQPIFWSIAEAMPDALSWKPISDESGQNMLGLKKPKAHASTDRLCQDEQQAYLFGWSMPITCGDAHPAVIPMVKYIHCSRGHAILVRKASELEVEVATTGAMGWCKSLGYRDGMLARVVATVGTATVWEKHIAKTEAPQKLSLVANSIRDAIAVQGMGTLQSKILWKVQGRRTTVAKQILKKKA